MHPILSRGRWLALYVLAWLLLGLLLATSLRGEASWLTATLLFLPVTLAYAFVALSSWYVCRAFPLRAGGPGTAARIVVVQAVAAAFAGTAWAGLTGAWAAALGRLAGRPEAEALYLDEQPLLFVVGALLFALAAALHYSILAFERSRQAETSALEASLLAREAELKAIRAQIDPHFIFNSLHSISALTTVNPAAARRMCLLLADFLRDTLRLGSNARIPLGEELALAERFLAIEQVRLGARLQVAREAEADALACHVPPLLLQPLVENAVVHGVSQLVDGGAIRLSARRTGSTLAITLENPCDPDRPRSRGVGLGLDLLRRRLEAQCGEGSTMHAAERDGWFRVDIRVPAVRDAPAHDATARAPSGADRRVAPVAAPHSRE